MVLSTKLDMLDIVKDYSYWAEEKREIISQIKESESLIYFRNQSVFNVLDYLIGKDQLDEDELHIFETAFIYIDKRIFQIENYLFNHFDDFAQFDELSATFNFMCDLEDFLFDFDMNDEDEERIRNHIMDIEDLLVDHKQIDNSNYEVIKEEMNLIIGTEDYIPIVTIFTQITENLNLI